MKKMINALMLALLGWAMLAPAPATAGLYPNSLNRVGDSLFQSIAGGGSPIAPVTAYTTPDLLFVANAGGMRWPNASGMAGGSAPYTGEYMVRKSAPWITPAGSNTLVFGLPSVQILESNSTVNERVTQNSVTVDAFSVKYTDASAVSRVVQCTLSGGGVLDANGTNGGVLAMCSPTVPIPANVNLQLGISLFGTNAAFPQGYDTMSGETSRTSTDTSFATVVNAGTSLAGNTGSSSATLQGGLYGPAFMVAKGGDGRPAMLADGDSICYGKGTTATIAPDSAIGIIEVPLHDTANGYAIPVINTCVAASGWGYTDPANASYTPTIAQYRRALIDQVTVLNGGVAPYTHYMSEQGTNSLGPPYSGSTAALVAGMKTRTAWLKAWHNLPVIQTTMIQKATSTDGWRTVANQTPANSDCTTCVRFQYNDKLLADNLDGVDDFSVNTYAANTPDTTLANRDKIAIGAFTATLTRDIATTIPNNGTVYLSAAPTVGMVLTLDPLSGTGNAKLVTGVTTITAGSEYQVSVVNGSSAGTYATKTAGTLVAQQYFADGNPATTGLHLSKPANENISAWVGTKSYTELKATLKSAVGGTWQ